MRIGPRAVTCLSDSAYWRERENRTESHNGDCFEHLRLEAALGLITRNLVKGSRLKVFAAVSPSRLNLPAIGQPQNHVAVALAGAAHPPKGAQGILRSVGGDWGTLDPVSGVFARAFKPVTVTRSAGRQRLIRTWPK